MNKIDYTYKLEVAAIHKLRVNAKSLAAEARIIRQEEQRCGGCYRAELTEHRRGRLRTEARYTFLALAFVRGRKYREVENKAKVKPEAARLLEKLTRARVPGISNTKVIDWLA